MIPELGNFALVLALIIALAQGTLPLVGAQRRVASWMNLARPAAQGQAVFVAIAFGCLTYSFVQNDFSVLYVASNSNSALPLQYRVAGVWGGHEGSLLLWVLMLSLWTMAVSVFSSHLPEDIVARVLGVLGLVSVGFLSFMLFTSNPFDRLLPAAMDGRDLNPLLQDPGMVIHPPMLYMGYVGFSVAFAFAIAALLLAFGATPMRALAEPLYLNPGDFTSLGASFNPLSTVYVDTDSGTMKSGGFGGPSDLATIIDGASQPRA